MTADPEGLRVGDKAPDFVIATVEGRATLHQLAARYNKFIVTTQDSYRYHPN
jgi:hypothetical protein